MENSCANAAFLRFHLHIPSPSKGGNETVKQQFGFLRKQEFVLPATFGTIINLTAKVA
jgi:hypothetical protein